LENLSKDGREDESSENRMYSFFTVYLLTSSSWLCSIKW